ncbi:MAG: hypothetical protein JSW60_05110 [Thermoplasmatales archaeon]|nr:MAG: hypothetical protein JSW60_05110 [Thermoplasmatales archaeon]
MIPAKIFEIGAMFGLNDKDIKNLVANVDKTDIPKASATSPLDNYKGDGIFYGTISINDFR